MNATYSKASSKSRTAAPPQKPKVDPQFSPLSDVKPATGKTESHSKAVGYHCAGGKSY